MGSTNEPASPNVLWIDTSPFELHGGGLPLIYCPSPPTLLIATTEVLHENLIDAAYECVPEDVVGRGSIMARYDPEQMEAFEPFELNRLSEAVLSTLEQEVRRRYHGDASERDPASALRRWVWLDGVIHLGKPGMGVYRILRVAIGDRPYEGAMDYAAGVVGPDGEAMISDSGTLESISERKRVLVAAMRAIQRERS